MDLMGLITLKNGFCLDKLLYLLIFVVGTSFAFDERYEKTEDAESRYKAINLRIDKGDLKTISAVYELTQMVIEERIANLHKVPKNARKSGSIDRLKRDYRKISDKLSKTEDRLTKFE